jgi:hypothetical protein
MPSSISTLLAAADLEHGGAVRWGSRVEPDAPGVYLVSLGSGPAFVAPTPEAAPIGDAAIEELLAARPELRLDGQRPSSGELARRIGAFWVLEEPVLYIGLAGTSMRRRVSQYYKTPLGARTPHAGGWFLKTLDILPDLWVHFAATPEPVACEDRLIETFVAGTSKAARRRLPDPERPFPFANLEWPKGARKPHGITGARAPRR